MDDTNHYLIRIREQVSERELNASSPLQVLIVDVDSDSTLLSVCADQSGLIGLLRYLHAQSIGILSFSCEY